MPKRTSYKALEPVITEMRMAGVSVSVIAKVLGLNKRILYSRCCDWGLNDLRRELEEEIAREISARHGLKAALDTEAGGAKCLIS